MPPKAPAAPAADLSEFFAFGGSRKRHCAISLLLAEVTGQDLVNLTAALAMSNDDLPPAAIMGWAKAKGCKTEIFGTSVVNHRKGRCSCGKS